MRQTLHKYLKVFFLASLIGLCLGLSACGGNGSTTTTTTNTGAALSGSGK